MPRRSGAFLGIMLREVGRKIGQASKASALKPTNLHTLMQRAERIRSQRPKDKNKLYALHAPRWSDQQRRWLKRRQAVEPAIGHLKHDNAMDRCWLQGTTGDALHAVLRATGYNIRWLLRAIVRLGLQGLLAPLFALLGALTTVLAMASDAGQKVSGLKRHIAVDTQGLPHAIAVSTAEVTERKGALHALQRCKPALSQVQALWCDSGYVGKPLAQGVQDILGGHVAVQIAKRSALHTFKVMPQRWVVERSFA